MMPKETAAEEGSTYSPAPLRADFRVKDLYDGPETCALCFPEWGADCKMRMRRKAQGEGDAELLLAGAAAMAMGARLMLRVIWAPVVSGVTHVVSVLAPRVGSGQGRCDHARG